MTGAAILAVLWPLSRAGARAGSAREADLAVYRDQLAEIERDRGRGLIGEPEAEAARIEVSRRLLAAADADAMPVPVPGALLRPTASVLALLTRRHVFRRLPTCPARRSRRVRCGRRREWMLPFSYSGSRRCLRKTPAMAGAGK
jgi:cytochrome c-type biogenesis protein CcmI